MAKTTNGQRSFRELVSEAPISARADTLRLVGALSRSHEAGKFVLTLADGRSVTLNIDAVKEHRVLGDAAGQQLVEVDLDAERVPRDIASATPGGFSPAGVVNPSPFPWSLFWLDYPKSPWTDTHPGHWPDVKIPYIDHQIASRWESHREATPGAGMAQGRRSRRSPSPRRSSATGHPSRQCKVRRGLGGALGRHLVVGRTHRLVARQRVHHPIGRRSNGRCAVLRLMGRLAGNGERAGT